MFDLSPAKLLVLAVIALVVFGPNELPKIAAQAGRALRDLRRIAQGARDDLREGLGPEFQDLDFEDLNPRRFVQKHLIDDPVAAPTASVAAAPGAVSSGAAADGTAINGTAANGTAAANGTLPKDAPPPFDAEAT